LYLGCVSHKGALGKVAAGVALVALITFVGCGSSTQQGFGATDDGGAGADGTSDGHSLVHPDSGMGDVSLNTDGAPPHTCNPMSEDLSGCSCTTNGMARACYTADPKTRNVGACKDGSQTCVKSGEVGTWGPCNGAVTPGTEDCAGMVDTNCNGKVGCADPTCAANPACNTGCTNGQTRPCYDGPSGTENVGVCKDGTQTCTNGQWPTACTGEVLPGPVNCCDAIDHACSGLPGCFNLFQCITAACCQPPSCMSQGVDPGCVCPQGAGDTETCPAGDHVVHKGGFPGYDECCPCVATDCTDVNCCGNAVCATDPNCSNMNCAPLPPSCNGQVDTDCDDFPEDCDEPCCLCRNCP
jgi:hypothetical protein